MDTYLVVCSRLYDIRLCDLLVFTRVYPLTDRDLYHLRHYTSTVSKKPEENPSNVHEPDTVTGRAETTSEVRPGVCIYEYNTSVRVRTVMYHQK